MNFAKFLRKPVLTTPFENYVYSDSIAQSLKQFTHISPTNFAIIFSSENIKRGNDNFFKM